MDYTVDTKVGVTLKDPEAVKIIEKYAPGVSRKSDDRTGKRNDPKDTAYPAASQAGRPERGNGNKIAERDQRQK